VGRESKSNAVEKLHRERWWRESGVDRKRWMECGVEQKGSGEDGDV